MKERRGPNFESVRSLAGMGGIMPGTMTEGLRTIGYNEWLGSFFPEFRSWKEPRKTRKARTSENPHSRAGILSPLFVSFVIFVVHSHLPF